MGDTVKVRYKGVGTPDEILVEGATHLGAVKRGDVIEVSHELAYGIEGVTEDEDGNQLSPWDDFDRFRAPKGGLLDQADAWELVDKQRGTKRDQTDAEPKDEE